MLDGLISVAVGFLCLLVFRPVAPHDAGTVGQRHPGILTGTFIQVWPMMAYPVCQAVGGHTCLQGSLIVGGSSLYQWQGEGILALSLHDA